MYDGFCFTMACHTFLSSVNLVALVRESTCLFLQSALMQSVHLLAGLPLGRLPCIFPLRRMWGYLFEFIRLICPKYLSLFVATLSMIVSSIFSCVRMCVFLSLSNLVTSMILLRHAISKVWSLFSSTFFNVHVSAPYNRIDNTRTLYSSTLVEQRISCDAQMPRLYW